MPPQVLEQTWFSGSHSDVGGGWASHGLSDISLAWMVSRLLDQPEGPLLRIDLDVLKRSQDRRRDWSKQPEHPTRGLLELKATRQFQHQFNVKSKEFENVVWANMLETGNSNENLHHSVITSGKYSPETSPQFDEIRKRNPELLKKIWLEASTKSSLSRTEKFLKWDQPDPDFAGGSPTEDKEDEALRKDSEAKSKQLLSLSAYAGGVKGALLTLGKVVFGPIYQVSTDTRTLRDGNLKPGPLKTLASKFRKTFGKKESVEEQRRKDEADGIVEA